MKRRSELLAKSLSGLTALTLVFSSVPVAHIHAEDMEAVDQFDEDASIEEDISSIYTVTEFMDFQKDEEGNFINEETKTKYGSLKAKPGTALEDLGLPEDLIMNGYYEADGPDILTTLEILDVDWILKSDIGEMYSESTPEGEYKFIPDFDTYVLESENLDEIKLTEGLKLLEIPVTISAEEETEAVQTETESTEPAPMETEYAEPTPAETEYAEQAPTETEYVEPAPSETEYWEEEIWETEYYEENNTNDTPASEEDIFSGLDDSMLGDDNATTITTYDENGNIIEIYQDSSLSDPAASPAADPNAPVGDGTAQDDGVVEVPEDSTSVPDDTAPMDPADTTAPITANVDLILADANDNPLYTYSEAEQSLLTLSTDVNAVIPAITIPLGCGTDLSALNAQFVLPTGKTLLNAYTEDSYAYSDFSQLNTRWYHLDVQHEDLTTTVYRLCITVEKASHNWGTADCTGSHCSNCSAVDTSTALGHDWADATCTEPKTCDRCGATKGEKLGHDWIDATCTEPKTCDRCGATKGNALGHDLYDDWQTTKNSTDTVHGEQIRYCHRDDCDYAATRALNIIGNPTNNTIANLLEGAQYNLNTKISFTAVGAAMGNTNPINGDVRYVPTSWNIQNTPGTFMDGYTGAFSITKAGSYTVSVTFQKQIYQDGWKATDVVDSKAVTFTVGQLVQGTLVQGTADAIKINPKTGDSTPILPFAIAAVIAIAAISGVVIYKKKH